MKDKRINQAHFVDKEEYDNILHRFLEIDATLQKATEKEHQLSLERSQSHQQENGRFYCQEWHKYMV